MTTLRNSFALLLTLFLFACSSQTYQANPIEVLVNNEKVTTFIGYDENLSNNYRQDFNTKSLSNTDQIIKQNHYLYTLKNELKSSDLVRLDLNNGTVKKIDYANAKALIEDSVYGNVNIVGDLAIKKYGSSHKEATSENLPGDAIFQMVSGNQRLFAFVETFQPEPTKTHLVELDKDSLKVINQIEIKDYYSFIAPVFNQDKIYYINDDESTLEVVDVNTKESSSIKLQGKPSRLRVTNDKLYIMYFPSTGKTDLSRSVSSLDFKTQKIDNKTFDDTVYDIIYKDSNFYLLFEKTLTKYNQEGIQQSSVTLDSNPNITFESFIY